MKKNTEGTNYRRQGDLILSAIRDVAPSSTAGTTLLVLAVGKESGHQHELVARLISGGLGGGEIYLEAPAALEIGGQPWRHDALDLPPGAYRYWTQRELSPEDEVIRVSD